MYLHLLCLHPWGLGPNTMASSNLILITFLNATFRGTEGRDFNISIWDRGYNLTLTIFHLPFARDKVKTWSLLVTSPNLSTSGLESVPVACLHGGLVSCYPLVILGHICPVW